MMQVENVKYFSVTVFIIKDFCTVQTFPLLLAYLIIRFLKLRAELVCCAKTCFWTIRRSDLENEIHFSKCSILLSNSISFRTLNFDFSQISSYQGRGTVRSWATIVPVKFFWYIFKSNGPDTKMDPKINRDRGQLYLFNSCLLQIVSSSGIISRNNHTLWNDVTSWQGSLFNQLKVSLILSLIIDQGLLLYHKYLWFIHNIILCQAYIYLFKQYRIAVV